MEENVKAANHNLEMEKAMRGIPKGEPLLLHTCCAPCAAAALPRLCGHFRVTLYFYNPNIWPQAEYSRRLLALRTLAESLPAAYPLALLEGPYSPAAFEKAAAGLENLPEGGARCGACFGLRLAETARRAGELGIRRITTTLTTGPRKDAETINGIGARLAADAGLMWLPADFKKKDGARQSAALCEEYGLYRQSYCGCAHSLQGQGMDAGAHGGAPDA